MTYAVTLAEPPGATAPVMFVVTLDVNILPLSAVLGPLVVRAAPLVGAGGLCAVPLPYISHDTMILPITRSTRSFTTTVIARAPGPPPPLMRSYTPCIADFAVLMAKSIPETTWMETLIDLSALV